jgi:hypothetical protein
LEEILQNKIEVRGVEFPLMHFKNYLRQGYYPFFNEPDYSQKLNNILNMTIETDIPMYAKMNVSTAYKLKLLLSIIAKSVPFKPNFTKISELVDVHRNQIVDFLYYFEKAGISMQLRDKSEGLRMLGKTDKIYLDNPNLMYAIGSTATDLGNVRETFFLNQMGLEHKVTSHISADFQIEEAIFEVGGKSKTHHPQYLNKFSVCELMKGVQVGAEITIEKQGVLSHHANSLAYHREGESVEGHAINLYHPTTLHLHQACNGSHQRALPCPSPPYHTHHLPWGKLQVHSIQDPWEVLCVPQAYPTQG